MMKRIIAIAILFLLCAHLSRAQVFIVDPLKGSDEASGSVAAPFKSLKKAAAVAAEYDGGDTVRIRLLPGLYTLEDKIVITRKQSTRHPGSAYLIEASVLPDDPLWTPAKMPVIQSVSPNNSTVQFPHASGFIAATDGVIIKGLKFLGNANPETRYYYPVAREDTIYKGLDIAQCYFIGERNSAPIQGAVWAHGAGINVSHCIFYGCKNALLLFKAISNFSVTHSIIVGAYEAAVWFGPFTAPFVFRDNIVSDCNFFWLRPEGTDPAYVFSNSVIANNKHYAGVYRNTGGLAAVDNNNFKENHIRKTATVILNEVGTEGLQKGYLNLSAQSDGSDIDAGIFRNRAAERK
ncbi:MAG: right-handed parallel beta-helix repeat-containing protein [Niabella sp.]|nr:right-handed parallel beta-helix repeat-containing protein [Niabella sp.]